MPTFAVANLNDLNLVAQHIVLLTTTHNIFCLYGNLGSGKTTLVQLIGKHLNVTDSISSPTYPIINEYEQELKKMYHIDMYRLKNTEEAQQIGIEEYFYTNNLCFIEWPDNFENLLPDNVVKIFIRKLDDNNRLIEIIYT